jgi:putative DNA primase/helicase
MATAMTPFDSTTATNPELDLKQQEVDARPISRLVVDCAANITIFMAAAVTTGGRWPCGEGRAPRGSVIFMCAEDAAGDTIVPRLMAAGADLTQVHIVTAVRDDNGIGRRAFNLQSDLQQLEAKIKEIGNVNLVVIDPISSYLGPKVDSHVNSGVRGVLEPVSEMASRLRVAVVSITHPPKGTGTTAINRFIGSVAFVAAARAAFMVTRDPDSVDRRLLLPVKNNLARLGKGFAFRLEQRIVGDPDKTIVASSVVWESSSVDITADAALRAADTQASVDTSAGAEAEKFLEEILVGGAIPQKEIKAAAEGNGLAWATVRRTKDRLGIKAFKDGMKGGWLWGLPKMLIIAEDAHLRNMSTFGTDEHLRGNGAAGSFELDDGLEILEFLRREGLA